MQKVPSHTKRGVQRGSGLIEALLASSLFGLLVIALAGALVYGQESSALAGARNRAAEIAQEGVEAARAMRDYATTTIAAGTHGFLISGNQWTFSGTSDVTDVFTRQATVSVVDSKRNDVSVTATWQQNQERTGTITVDTRFTNWQDSNGCVGVASQSLDIVTSGAQTNSSDNTQVIGITIDNCGASSVTISQMALMWSGGEARNKITGITINGSPAWSGSQNSGAVLPIANFTLDPSVDSYPITLLQFKKSMSGATLSITFTMTDGSTKTVSGISL